LCFVVAGGVGFVVVRIYMAGLDMGPAGDPAGEIRRNVTIMLATLFAPAGGVAGAVFRSVDGTFVTRR
jgi:hypothetical protein